jgi:ATP-dependent Lon protease
MAKDEKTQEPDKVEIVKTEKASQPSNKAIVLARQMLPGQLPIIPLNNRPVFPRMPVPLLIENEDLIRMLHETAKSQTKIVGLVLKREQETVAPEELPSASLYKVGVAAEVLQLAQAAPGSPLQVLLGVIERFKIEGIVQEKPHIVAKVEYLFETDMSGNEDLKAYSLAVIKSIKDLVQLNPLHKEELNILLARSKISEPGRLADIAAALTTAGGAELQDVLETVNIRSRLRKVLMLLKKEIDISEVQGRINKQIEDKVTTQQREFFLREQLKAIKKELGLAKEGKEAEVERFEERIKKLKLTTEASERIKEEIDKLKLLEPTSPEFNVSRTYLDWLTILPWGIFTKDSYDIRKARKILDHDHYGLGDVKERILEFLAVGIMKGNISGTIICFVGPPGVGKTSLGQSIARSIGRNFYRFSVGGIRDEAEIKGHRRTYIGALPGKFIMAMKTSKSANPVIMIDEIDKIGASYQGDPASALLEVLDPEQNKEFLDHYLDVRFDLSNVFFICTANQLDTIPRALLDRMEVIKLAGYIMQEKMEIATRHLIPKQLAAHGVTKEQVDISSDALREVIEGYSREPGVRGMENHLKTIIRKSVKQIVEKKRTRFHIGVKDIRKLLGRRQFTEENYRKKPASGIVMGLAWTSMGGDTLYVEATNVDTGKGGFKQTGQLGNVMIESSEIAYTYVRSFLNANAKARDFFQKNYIHLHVPAGATPKDGPSAGVTMASALYSLALNKPIKAGFAMTGELSLAGWVMPIGGLKEKTIAAKRVNVVNLVFPAENKKDFDELPAHIKRGLKPHFVRTFREVVKLCFN